MAVAQLSFAAVPLSGHTVLGVEPTLAVLALVFGSLLYWDARSRSMETAELWGVLIAGLWLTSIVAGLVAVVGYLGTRPGKRK